MRDESAGSKEAMMPDGYASRALCTESLSCKWRAARSRETQQGVVLSMKVKL